MTFLISGTFRRLPELFWIATGEERIETLALLPTRKRKEMELPAPSPTPPPPWEGHLREWIAAWEEGMEKGLPLPPLLLKPGWSGRVQVALLEIERGTTRTYGEVARRLGHPRAFRAVARACATNSLTLLIPCHRVISAGGRLGGYRGGEGVATKALLLWMEGALPAPRLHPTPSSVLGNPGESLGASPSFRIFGQTS